VGPKSRGVVSSGGRGVGMGKRQFKLRHVVVSVEKRESVALTAK